VVRVEKMKGHEREKVLFLYDSDDWCCKDGAGVFFVWERMSLFFLVFLVVSPG
jgi:hypothetical protein